MWTNCRSKSILGWDASPLLGKVAKLSEVLWAGGINCTVPRRELAVFKVLFLYKCIPIGLAENCQMLASLA